jgi:hypothetical protein
LLFRSLYNFGGQIDYLVEVQPRAARVGDLTIAVAVECYVLTLFICV